MENHPATVSNELFLVGAVDLEEKENLNVGAKERSCKRVKRTAAAASRSSGVLQEVEEILASIDRTTSEFAKDPSRKKLKNNACEDCGYHIKIFADVNAKLRTAVNKMMFYLKHSMSNEDSQETRPNNNRDILLQDYQDVLMKVNGDKLDAQAAAFKWQRLCHAALDERDLAIFQGNQAFHQLRLLTSQIHQFGPLGGNNSTVNRSYATGPSMHLRQLGVVPQQPALFPQQAPLPPMPYQAPPQKEGTTSQGLTGAEVNLAPAFQMQASQDQTQKTANDDDDEKKPPTAAAASSGGTTTGESKPSINTKEEEGVYDF